MFAEKFMLTRRQFLQVLGITTAASTLGLMTALDLSVPIDPFIPPTGDLLARTLVRKRTHLTDRVAPILETTDRQIRTWEGWIHRGHIQPILALDYHPPTTFYTEHHSVSGWVNVAAPSAAVWQSASALSVLLTTIGHGGIMHVIDRLPPQNADSPAWIALATADGDLLGWSQAHLWRAAHNHTPIANNRYAAIDREARSITAYQDDQAVFSAPISIHGTLHASMLTIDAHRLGASIIHNNQQFYGVAHTLAFGEQPTQVIGGAWWHNRFGTNTKVQGHAVQTTIHAARALYTFLPDGAELHIV